MRALTPRSRLHGEQGASLAIILALICILGICVGAIATQGTAGMLAVKGVKNQRGDVYGAEGAVDGAINYIRNDLSRGRTDTDTCPGTIGSTPIFQAPSDVGTVSVYCRTLGNSGLEQGGTNYPENAILTTNGLPNYPTAQTSCSPEAGICIDNGSSSGVMTVNGSVKSNATSTSGPSIDANNGSKLDAKSNSIRAAGTCSGTVTGAPVKCGTGLAYADPGGAYNSDPTSGIWAADLQSVPAVAPAPTCNSKSKIATMLPGSYFSRDQMLLGFSTVVSGTRISCPVVWMSPGDYYFDLDRAVDGDPWRIGYDDAGNTNNLYNDVFTGTDIPGSVVIGGTLNPAINVNATTSQVSLVRSLAPGACNQAAANGVQVMMANYNAFDVKDQGILELCPTPSSGKQQIALYGRKTDGTGTSATATFKPTTSSAASPAWNPAANLLAIDGATASASQTGNSKTNTVTLGNFAATGLSAEQSISSITMKITHQETTVPSNLSTSIKATLTGSDGSTCNTTTAFTKQSALTAQTWTIPSTCINALSDLTGANVKFDVIGSNSGSSPTLTSILDGIEITANYTAQGLQAKAAGSKIVWMYGHYANHKPQIYIWGTVYAPTARIELGLESVSTTIARFGRGVIVNAINVTELGVSQPFAMFSNATGVPWYQNRYIELIAKIGGTRELRVVLQLDDQTDGSPGKKVTVVSWNAVN